jgi:hypothetical protein
MCTSNGIGASVGAFAGLVGVAAGVRVRGAGQSRWCRVGTGVRSWVGAGGVSAKVDTGVDAGVGVQEQEQEQEQEVQE